MTMLKLCCYLDFGELQISTKFHLGGLERIMVSLPGSPVYTISKRSMDSIQVLAVQVRNVTFSIPPGTNIVYCTRAWNGIIVSISC